MANDILKSTVKIREQSKFLYTVNISDRFNKLQCHRTCIFFTFQKLQLWCSGSWDPLALLTAALSWPWRRSQRLHNVWCVSDRQLVYGLALELFIVLYCMLLPGCLDHHTSSSRCRYNASYSQRQWRELCSAKA